MINWNVNVIGINRVSGGIVPEYQAYLDPAVLNTIWNNHLARIAALT